MAVLNLEKSQTPSLTPIATYSKTLNTYILVHTCLIIFSAFNEISSTLRYVHLLVITSLDCQKAFGPLINNTKIFVSTPDFKSPCNVGTVH